MEVYRPDDFNRLAERIKAETCIIMNIFPIVRGVLFQSDFFNVLSKSELLRENEVQALRIIQLNNGASVKIESEEGVFTITPGETAIQDFSRIAFTKPQKAITMAL